MWRNPNVIAASVLGAAMVVSAAIIAGALGTVGAEIRQKPLGTSTANAVIPGTVTIRLADPVVIRSGTGIRDGNPPAFNVNVQLQE